MKKSTIRDVAKLAGVSIGTVSKVINKQGNVQGDLQQKVKEAIKALNYSPNMIARSLKSSISRTIAVILSNITNPFQMALAKGIEEVAFNNDYRVIICSTNEDPETERKNLKMFYEQRVDGIILCSTGKVNDELHSLIERNVPIVLVDRPIYQLNVDIVADDNEIGMRKLIAYLYEIGHRKIGVVHGDLNTIHGKLRYKAALQTLKEYGILTNYQYIGDFTYEGGQRGLEHFLSLKEQPTAILSSNNNMTAGILKASQRLKIQIPDQFTLVSFGELEYLWDLILPKVTSVIQSPKKIGREAALILLKKRIDNETFQPPIRKLIEPYLSLGNSSTTPK